MESSAKKTKKNGAVFKLRLLGFPPVLGIYIHAIQSPEQTGVKQCTFHRLISNDAAQKEMVLNSLIIHHLIMNTYISYKIIFTISLPKLINVALL